MTTLPLPSTQSLARAVTELSQGANAAERRALDKAYYVLARGLNIVTCGGALLIPGSKGDIYRVSPDGSCNCPASGRCYHQALADLIIEAQAHPTMPRLTKSRDVVMAEMDECF